MTVQAELLDPSVVTDLENCRTRLSKKATFESAVSDACLLVRKNQAQTALEPVQSKLMEVCTRCMTLLKTRYTSSVFWTAGKDLLALCQVTSLFHNEHVTYENCKLNSVSLPHRKLLSPKQTARNCKGGLLNVQAFLMRHQQQ